MTDKQIIKTFSDGYCLVLHENRVSLRENNYTKYQIVVGPKTNELFEFVKELYLDNKAKEQECERWKKEIINRNEKIEELRFSVSDLTNRLCDLNAEKSFRIVDLEQTLTEIKEIAEREVKRAPDGETFARPEIKQILQKISEVLKDE